MATAHVRKSALIFSPVSVAVESPHVGDSLDKRSCTPIFQNSENFSRTRKTQDLRFKGVPRGTRQVRKTHQRPSHEVGNDPNDRIQLCRSDYRVISPTHPVATSTAKCQQADMLVGLVRTAHTAADRRRRVLHVEQSSRAASAGQSHQVRESRTRASI